MDGAVAMSFMTNGLHIYMGKYLRTSLYIILQLPHSEFPHTVYEENLTFFLFSVSCIQEDSINRKVASLQKNNGAVLCTLIFLSICDDQGAGWSRDRLIKGQVDHVTGWSRDRLIKGQIVQGTDWSKDRLIKGQVEKKTDLSRDRLIKGEIDQGQWEHGTAEQEEGFELNFTIDISICIRAEQETSEEETRSQQAYWTAEQETTQSKRNAEQEKAEKEGLKETDLLLKGWAEASQPGPDTGCVKGLLTGCAGDRLSIKQVQKETADQWAASTGDFHKLERAWAWGRLSVSRRQALN